MNVIFSLVLICTTLHAIIQNCNAARSTSTQVITKPSVPTVPDFNCDPDKYFMCDRLEKVQAKIEVVGLCQEELSGETFLAKLMAKAPLFSRVAVACSQNDWSAGARMLGEAQDDLMTILDLVKPFLGSKPRGTHFGFHFANSYPDKVIRAQADCLGSQIQYFDDYQRYSQYISNL